MIDTVSVLESFRRTAVSSPDSPALVYFDTVFTATEVDRATDALAVALEDKGFAAGDRVALHLQNVPQYVIGLIAAWKLGGIAVPINPMLTAREVSKLLDDATPTVFLTLNELHTPELAEALAASSVLRVITTSALDWQGASDKRVLPTSRMSTPSGAEDLKELIARHDGRAPVTTPSVLDDVAVITYTSGTTGAPKGAMNTHRNIATGAHAYRDWFDLGPRRCRARGRTVVSRHGIDRPHRMCARIGGAARAVIPLQHRCGSRHDPQVQADLHCRCHHGFHRVGQLVGGHAIRLRHPGEDRLGRGTGGCRDDGAFERRFGIYIHNVYGMTETTSPVLAVPMGTPAPVGAETGALSVGIPMGSAQVAVVDDAGARLGPGEIGELAVAGPQIVPGYWCNDDETSAAFRDGWLLTGDVGYVDEGGWYYLVDRKKDMIVASGYKVWPREVEDVLYTHEAVLEAGVVANRTRTAGNPSRRMCRCAKAIRSSRRNLSSTAANGWQPTNTHAKSKSSMSSRKPQRARSCGAACGRASRGFRVPTGRSGPPQCRTPVCPKESRRSCRSPGCCD